MRLAVTVEFETDFENEDDIEAFAFGVTLAENLTRIGFPYCVTSVATDIDETFFDENGRKQTVGFK